MSDTFYDAGSYVEKYNETNTGFAVMRKEEIHRFIQNNNMKVKSILDLASGTGLFLQLMQKDLQIEKCVGLDFSEKMIKFSKENVKNKHIEFVYGDMTNFNLNEKFEMITCNYDAINHVENFEGWSSMFKLAYEHLNDGGYFTFDYNTVLKLKKSTRKTDYIKKDDYNLVMKIHNKNDKLNFELSIYNKLENGLLSLEELNISESIFPNKDIMKALKDAGFKNIKFCDEKFNRVNPNKTTRAYVLCKK